MRTRTPPLSTLRLFDAAGRHLSFARAAAELHVTPSAVSHGIVGLEKALGVKLFLRESGKLSLTREGADYLTYVSEALSLIAVGTRRLPTPHSGRTIAVSCAPTIASRWLLPRIHAFRMRHPRIAITLDTSHRPVGFPVDGFDFAIRMSRIPVAPTHWTHLFGEWLVPVCSPAYREAVAASGSFDPARATTLHVTSLSEDWQAWLEAIGKSDVPSLGTMHFDTIQLSLEAAAAGLGVALGRRFLMVRELQDGVLVEVGQAVPAATTYWLVSSEMTDHEQDLRSFRDWLLAEAAAFAAFQAESVSPAVPGPVS
ncbi:LysR substrate-binding domain-containing protein [Methylobacterium durans]|uniref:LysR substrate-binding domain-containing protein n=1 Tax=Methylobacterium durans TaxID=2202825 RepID=UPI002AFF1CB2|nr:LysR substrate-binding domain-containing protein [Methylobacterium durans]MEA1830957.1 LysR substrate-binding domain-containing protein [Methylobacterium durans]